MSTFFCSYRSGVLAENEEDRCGIHRAGDWSGQSVPAQCHHCALPHLSGCHVRHLPPPPLLQAAGAAALEPRGGAPLPVSPFMLI